MTGATAPDIVTARPALGDRLRRPSWAFSIGLFVVAAGWTIGVRPLSDNSFLTHLATGRIILDTGSVPTRDPYTFTASGEPWVVQSWLVSWLYASAEAVGGLGAVRLVTGALAALLAGLGWTLLRPVGGLVVRIAAAAMFVTVGANQWSERPFMVGLVCLAATALAMEGRLDPRWLVPLGWVWVNSHGSFPLGLVMLLVAALGARLDGQDASTELRCLRWAGLGTLLGALSPLGPRILLFPVELLARQDILEDVIEWRAPTFDTIGQRTFILQLAVVLIALTRRPSYRSALLAAVFTAAALLGSRNLVVASVVLLVASAPGLDGVGSIHGSARPSAARLAGLLGLVGLLAATLVRSDQPDLDLKRYPIDALAYLEEQGIDTRDVRMATPDIAGNAIELVYGGERRVFYDDRFDMFPDDITRAHLALVRAEPSLQEDLDRLDVDLVTVVAGSPTAQVLSGTDAWRVLYLDERWTLLCRRTAVLADSTRC